MQTIKIIIGLNRFRSTGFTLADVRADLDRFWLTVGNEQQRQVDALTARLHNSTDGLQAAETRANPGAASGG